MGTTLFSIHLYGDAPPVESGLAFRSFSPGWQTCVEDLSTWDPVELRSCARSLSRKSNLPVLLFFVFDSDELSFSFYLNGKEVSCYCDVSGQRKKLFSIPGLVGYEEGQKRRLSTILGCGDTELKIELLEEYFGVCLLFCPECLEEPDTLVRKKGDAVYQTFLEAEKKLTGTAAPIELKKAAEYPGKLFYNGFSFPSTLKPHYFLWGLPQGNFLTLSLSPVHFSGPSLEPSDLATFRTGHEPRDAYWKRFFQLDYRGRSSVLFSDLCPPAYCGKRMVLPDGFWPDGFTASGKLLLSSKNRIFIADESLSIIAKLPIKGEVADLVGDYILTTVGNSFFAYDYEPNAKIFIYEIIEKTDK